MNYSGQGMIIFFKKSGQTFQFVDFDVLIYPDNSLFYQ